MKEIHQSSIMETTGEPPVIGSIHSIPLSAIHPMPNNPFQVRDDPAMNELVESISQFGIIYAIYFENCSDDEYASRVNLTKSGVAKQRRKILSRLRKLMNLLGSFLFFVPACPFFYLNK